MKNLLLASTVIASLLLSSCGSNSGISPEKEADKMPGSNIAGSKPNGNNQTQTNVPQPTPTKVPEKKLVKAKGLYLTATSAGARLKHYIELANTTEINSYVIDYKNDDGNVTVNSSVPAAKEVKAIDVRYDPEKVTKELRDNNIYSIARIVCFKDPYFSKGKPEVAIKNKNGGLYIHNGVTWVNPYSMEAWQYNIDLAKEALAKGFDEVQFDYVRFPDGKKSNMVFGNNNNKQMYETINDFLAEARKQMPNAILSADVFAIICETPGDNEGIGQYLEHIGKDIDYIYPMAYPSHYALGQIINGTAFKKPDLDPYGVIKNTLLKAKDRLAKVEGSTPKIRTYIQDFDASWIGKGNWQHYDNEQVRQQIQGVYDAGYEEWFVWDPMNSYHEGAFKKE
ncbi:putative glycoside hydrolase [Pseudobacteroides cellulosolvens]|nr:putative glycoside hydrolase [Pseudobacteroides cellulosolvens]